MYKQDTVGGLEIQTLDGRWINATPIPGTIVINIGELLQFWSNGRYRATPHRVRINASNALTSRFSIATFIHPNYDTLIYPIGADTHAEEPKTSRYHLSKRFHETYNKK